MVGGKQITGNSGILLVICLLLTMTEAIAVLLVQAKLDGLKIKKCEDYVGDVHRKSDRVCCYDLSNRVFKFYHPEVWADHQGVICVPCQKHVDGFVNKTLDTHPWEEITPAND